METSCLLRDLAVGDRVELSSGTDAWMRGDRYGQVVKVGRRYIHVWMDRSGKVRKVPPQRIGRICWRRSWEDYR